MKTPHFGANIHIKYYFIKFLLHFPHIHRKLHYAAPRNRAKKTFPSCIIQDGTVKRLKGSHAQFRNTLFAIRMLLNVEKPSCAFCPGRTNDRQVSCPFRSRAGGATLSEVVRSEVRVDLRPLRYGRYDVQRYQLVTHLAEVLVACVQLGVLLSCALGYRVVSAVSVERGVHGHHDVVVLVR